MNRESLISSLYSASVHRTDWSEPLNALCEQLGLWASQIIGVDKRTRGLIFSAGAVPARLEVELDYIRFYHTTNPRLLPALQIGPQDWFHCHQHFDEAFVAQNSFYQEFLIPHGGRYLSATKLIDDGSHVFMLGVMRGVGSDPVGQAEMPILQTLKHHATEALRNHLHVRKSFAEAEMARALFNQFRHPMLVIDESRGVWHANDSARTFLHSQGLLRVQDGFLMCGSHEANNRLTEAVRLLTLERDASVAPDVTRRVVTLSKRDRSIRLFVSPLRPEQAMGMFGAMPRALIIVHDSAQPVGELDPLLAAECFSLSPAEARVAVHVANGLTVKEIAGKQGTSIATIRTQLQRVMEKVGVTRQADLVRILVAMPLARMPTDEPRSPQWTRDGVHSRS